MNRNILYVIIGALAQASIEAFSMLAYCWRRKRDPDTGAVVAVGLSYQFYQERQKTTGVEISIGERGISIEKK